MSSNGATLADEEGSSPDWIELYNPSDAAVQLAGYGLSDRADEPVKWRFESGVLPPHEYMLVFASGKDRQPSPVTSQEPAKLDGLALWLSADQIDTNDSAQVEMRDGFRLVNRWPDLSERNHHATQSDPLRRPKLITTQLGNSSVPALQFDGRDDLLRINWTPARDNFCVIALFKTSVPHEIDSESAAGVGGVSGQRYLFGAAHGGDQSAGAGLSAGVNGISVYEHGSGYMPALAVHDRQLPSPLSIVGLNYSSRQPALYLQGNQVRTGHRSARPEVTAPTEIGSGHYGSFLGELLEVLIYDRPLTGAEHLQLAAFFAAKYGIPIPAYYHTSFELNSRGESILLSAPDGTVVDQVSPVVIPRDVSYGRELGSAERWLFFKMPTPNRANTTPGAAVVLEKPLASHPSGIYTAPFSLSLTAAEGARIHYTLDGSIPTEASPRYTAPISVGMRLNEPNRFANIPTGGGWQPPKGAVAKMTTIRAIAFHPEALPSDLLTRSYLVHNRGTNRYHAPIISIISAPENFFSAETGIYVPGRSPGGNYFNRGEEWERPIYIEFFEPDGTQAFAQEAGVRIHGGTSRQFPQKNLRLYATKQGGRTPFRHKIFPTRAQSEWERLILRASGHDHHLTFFRDALMQEIVRDLDLDLQAYRPSIVFLNGEYWGIHNIRESLDQHYLAAHHGVDPKQVDILEGHFAVNEGNGAAYQSLLDFIKAHDLALPHHYAEAARQIDVSNFIDYRIAEIFFYRWDIGNIKYWRPQLPEGKWRWFLFDTDVGFGGFATDPNPWLFNMLAYDTEPNGPWSGYTFHDHNNPTATFLLRSLLRNRSFRHQFINRFADLLNSTFQPKEMISLIDQFEATIAPWMQEHIDRWRAPGSVQAWRQNVEYLRVFARNRPAAARQQLTDYFQLPTPITLRLAVGATNAGRIKINSVFVAPPVEAPWSGQYFRSVPITLSAVPNPGYRFDKWEGLLSTNSTLTLELVANTSLTAHFVEEDPEASRPLFHTITALTDPRAIRLAARARPLAAYLLEHSRDLERWETGPIRQADSNGQLEMIFPLDETAEDPLFFRLREQ